MPSKACNTIQSFSFLICTLMDQEAVEMAAGRGNTQNYRKDQVSRQYYPDINVYCPQIRSNVMAQPKKFLCSKVFVDFVCFIIAMIYMKQESCLLFYKVVFLFLILLCSKGHSTMRFQEKFLHYDYENN